MTAPQQPPSQNVCGCTTTPKETTYSDSSGAIFSMYIDHAQKFDDENVENWKGGAESILLFTGIFSATVATFIAMSYPTLKQDPNDITQSLLRQISQQLANPNRTIPSASLSDQSSFTPSASVVFVNSVWFLSLVLSLTCALIATLLQHWARRYLQMIRKNYPPHDRAHIREYFSLGARRFRIFALVEALPFLLLVSVLLFFAGLVAFAFLANRTAACFTSAIVGFCILSYISLSLMPLKYHDCPYHTPFTSLIWYTGQLIPLSWFWLTHHSTKRWYARWGGEDRKKKVESFRVRKEKWLKSFSEGRIAKLDESARAMLPTMDIYKKTLVRTLNWLTEDRELEKFVDGIPGLCESEALAKHKNGDPQRTTIRDVLAALPGPMSFHKSLPWSIIKLARRAFTSGLQESARKQRTQACLKALYYIPGAIRDVLAPYAAMENHASEILPLLNSPESLEIIKELQTKSNDDVSIPVRCVAAVVAAYMITSSPPPNVLDHDSRKQFLDKRLRIDGDGGVAIEYHSDSARLQNIVCFLTDIREMLGNLNKQWWTSKNWNLIRKERAELFRTRHNHHDTEKYSTSDHKFDHWEQLEGNRMSPGFMSAAQLDLITLTLEILVRDPIAKATDPQRKKLEDAYKKFKNVAFTKAVEEVSKQRSRQRAWLEIQATDGFKTVEGVLGSLWGTNGERRSSSQGAGEWRGEAASP
ncbi:hypothetical protein EDB83DRAFT_1834103 [Lactarius deliciosus]|nr:hypothetical protein EDB83DRAFT_1834103 [Lactarius deliciosus]